jgi:hypothetical protein
MRKQDREYYKDLSKEVGIFVSGIFIGPVVDFAELVKKHGPILHKKMAKEFNKRVKFLKEVK